MSSSTCATGAALEALHGRHDHDGGGDVEDRARRLLTDPRVPMPARIRLAGAFGTVMSGILLASEVLEDVPTDELRAELRAAVRDLLAPVGAERAVAVD